MDQGKQYPDAKNIRYRLYVAGVSVTEVARRRRNAGYSCTRQHASLVLLGKRPSDTLLEWIEQEILEPLEDEESEFAAVAA